VCAAATVLYRRDTYPAARGVVLTFAVVSAVLTFLALIHSHRTIYSGWMRFAEVLHTVVVTLLFGACYLLVVPLFFLIAWVSDPLRLRRSSNTDSFWIRRKTQAQDTGYFERMG
jgi:hypothetical protein